MTTKTWTLTNRDDRTWLEPLTVTPDDVGGPARGYSIRKHQLRGGPSDGVDIVHVDNGLLRFAVLPTRGMGVWKAWVGQDPIGWHSPVPGPVHPAFVPLSDPSGLGWLDGFDELVVRCGLQSNGAPEFDAQGTLRYGLHGLIANKPAHCVQLAVDGDSGTITLTGLVDETRFHFAKLRLSTTIRTRVGQPRLEIVDTIENLSESPTEIQLLYHINLGPPWLGPGASVVAPVAAIVPRNEHAASGLGDWARYPEPVPGTVEQVYFLRLQSDADHNTRVILKNPQQTAGIGLQFNTEQLPCFTLWKNPTAESDGYVTGLEPATNYPNTRSFEQQQGRVIPLAPRQQTTFQVNLEVYQDAQQLNVAEQAVAQLQAKPATTHPRPLPDWCEGA